MSKHKFKKFTTKERKELALDKVPDTMYATEGRNLKAHTPEELPIRYDDIEDEEEL